jgi:autotransporter-associated beta strand protein
MAVFSNGAALRRFRSRLLVAASLLAVTTAPAMAQATSWIGTTGNWTTGTNWNTSTVPPSGDDVTIGNGGTAQVNTAVGTVRSVTVKGGSTLDIQTSGSLATQFGFATTAGDGSGTASNGTILLSGGTLTNTVQLVTGTLSATADTNFTGQISLIGANNLISAASGRTLTLNFSSITSGGTAIGGGGTVVYTGDTYYTGATTINAGSTLQLGSGASFGSIQGGGGIVNNGTLAISYSGTFNQSANVSGTGGITILAANTATVGFNGTNSYSGTTDVQGGILQLNNAGGISANSTFNVGASGTVQVLDLSATLKGLTGSGTLQIRKIDPGPALTLTLNSANFTGTLTENSSTLANVVIAGGTSILAGTNSWTGTTTVNSGATLQFGNGSTNGSIPTGTITNNGTVGINRSDNITYGGVIGGSGGLVKSGAGTLTLTSASTYSGGTTVAGGTLSLGVSGAAGTGAITTTGSVIDYANGIDVANSIVINSTTTQLQALTGVTATQSGVISETGGARPLEKIGAGTLILTGANTYTGVTTITAGTLQIGAGGTAGGIAGNIANNSTLTFNRSDDVTYAGVISGTGGLTKQGSNTLILTGANTYTGGTTISVGTIQVGAGGTAGSITGNVVVNGASLTFNRSDAYTFAGNVSGTGTLIVNGGGTLTVTGTNTNANSTNINNGSTLQVGNGGTSGSIASTVNVNTGATLQFNRSDTVTFDQTIAGVGTLSKIGSNTLILTGFNVYTGATVITAGTLQVGAGGTAGNLGSGNVSNSGTLAFNRSDAMTYAGVISGTGAVSKAGAGTTTLTGANTYTGGTTITAGSLRLGTGGSLASTGAMTVNGGSFDLNGISQTVGALSGTGGSIVLGSGTLTTSSSSNTTLASVISGTGGFTRAGTGTIILTGANTYTGGTTISGGTLQLGNGGATGSIAGNVVNNGTLAVSRTANTYLFFAGEISGTGSVSVLSGIFDVTGTNTYTGGTTVASGAELDIANGGTAGSITGNIANSGAVIFNRSDSYTYSGIISGTGTVGKSGGASGTLILTGANTYTGTTTIYNGTLQIGAGGTSGSIVSDVTGGSTLSFNRSDSLTYAGVVSSTVALTQTGTGTTILTGANTYTGGTTIAAGTLQIGAGGTAGSITGNVANSGTLAFNRTDAVTFAGVVSGTGGLSKLATNTLILTGANTYTGTTTISAGTLQIGAGGTAGSIAGNVANSGTLAFNRSDAVTYAGVISGTGSLSKLAANILTLTGTSTYTGATTVSAGTLAVNGAIASSAVTVASGATLGGTGTVGGTTIQSGGTLAPGNSIGTLNVTGNLTLASGSIYAVELSPTAADRTVVSGTATLNGTLALNQGAGTYTAGTSLTLLTAGNVSGTFASVTGLSFAGLQSQIVYSATSVQLVLSSLAVVVPPAPVVVNFTGRTPNQIAAAAALNAAPSSGPLRTALTAYLTANPAQMEAVLDSMSGEIHATLRSAALEDSRLIRNTVQSHLDVSGEGTNVWGYAFADYGWLDSDGNAAEARRNNAGFIAGVDTLVAEGLRLGAGGSYMEHKVGAAARGSRAAGTRGSLLAYASYESGALKASLGGNLGWGSDDITRAVAALGETEASSRDSETGGIFARLSYNFGLPVLPYAGFAHASVENGAFAETGGLAALSGGAVSDSQTYSLLGFNLALGALDFNGLALTPRADIAWSHGFDVTAPGQRVTLGTGQSFTVLGTPIGMDAAALQLGFDLQLVPQALLSVGYDGLLSGRGQSHALRGGLNWRF